MGAVDLLRAEDQFGERQREQRADLLAGPVVADQGWRGVGSVKCGKRHG